MKKTLSFFTSTKGIPQDDARLTINLYPEKISDTVMTARACPGSEVVFDQDRFGGGRAGISAQERIFAIQGAFLTEQVNGTSITRGVLDAVDEDISLISNGFQLLIVNTAHGYVFKLADNSFVILPPESGFQGGNGIAAYCGGRGVCQQLDGTFPPKFQCSDQYDFTNWNGVAFQAAQSLSEITGMIGIADWLYIFSGNSYEGWQDQGYPIFPYRRVVWGDNAGIESHRSAQAFQGSIFWLAKGQEGNRNIFMATVGSRATSISDAAISRLIDQIADPSDAIGLFYQALNSWFYIITFVSGNLTLAYDLGTGMWHRRAWRDPSTGQYIPVPYITIFENAGDVYCVDYRNGQIHRQSEDLYQN